MPNLVGKTLSNRYLVREFIGHGGMAEIYLVWDSRRTTNLAMKVLQERLEEDPTILNQFKKEANTLSNLRHPNIVGYYGIRQDLGRTYFLMDHVEGHTLGEEIRRKKRQIHPTRIRKVFREICSALHYSHSMGFVHCDLKPSNILVDKSGAIKITDFGLARMSETSTSSLPTAGTPPYMSPEQIRGDTPIRAFDIYALGVIIFELFTGGERPFTGQQATAAGITGTLRDKIRWEHQNIHPPPPSQFNRDISPELDAIVLRCLEKNPFSRYANVLDLLNALEQALPRKKGDAPPPPPEPPPSDKPGKKLLIPGWLGVVMAGIVVLIIAFVVGLDIDIPLGPSINTQVSGEIPFPTPLPEEQPNALPRIGSITESRIAFRNNTDDIWSKKSEVKSVDSYIFAGEKNINYTVDLYLNQEMTFSFGWCAADQHTLERNWEDIVLTFSINDNVIPIDQFYKAELVDLLNHYCRGYYLVLSKWPSGVHDLDIILVLLSTINDGINEYSYPEGNYHIHFSVNVWQ